MDRSTVAWLLESGSVPELDGFRSRAGKEFKTGVEIGADGRLVFVAGDGTRAAFSTPEPTLPRTPARQGDDPERTSRSVGGAEAAPRPVLGPCPVHHEAACQVVETRGAYACETRLKELRDGAGEPQGFLLPKMLCQRPMTREEALALMRDGATGELKGFVSKAGRPFSAKLEMAAGGRCVFVFAGPAPVRNARTAASKRDAGSGRPNTDGASEHSKHGEERADRSGRSYKYPPRRAGPSARPAGARRGRARPSSNQKA